MALNYACTEYNEVSRRDFLFNGLQSAAGLFLGSSVTALPQWMPRVALADPYVGPSGDTLVCVFLRGGADGLNIIVPYGDESYYDSRPTIAIPRPDDRSADLPVIDLDGFFGLHPALQPLDAIYRAGEISFVQATGSPDETRSHFEAMDMMERGAVPGEYSGWLARHLGTLDTSNRSSLRAVSVGDMLPASLTGALSSTALQSVESYHLWARESSNDQLQDMLSAMYARAADMHDSLLNHAARQTVEAIDLLGQIDSSRYLPGGRDYPERAFGQAMKTVAQLVHAEVGVEVACVDLGGWDTHVAQGASEGQMARLLTELAEGLAAFYEDMGPKMQNVTVVVMSEFGRRVKENGGLGTDHGHGNMMMVMSGGLQKAQVFANWPGLHPDLLTGPGDVVITTDYRDILGELIHKRLNNPNLESIFAGYAVTEHGLFIPRV